MAFKSVPHPLIRHKLGLLRRHDISTANFRDLTREITYLLAYEAFDDLELDSETITGWAGPVSVDKLAGKRSPSFRSCAPDSACCPASST